MRIAHLILAMQFLTRLPMPATERFDPRDLSRSAVWFPFVGLIVGSLVAGAAALGSRIDPWLGAFLGVIAWIWITGALHLDGLADLADALGASHRDPERFLKVLQDPHVGTFGTLSLVVAVLAKLLLLSLLLREPIALAYIPLICAWARWGALIWSNTLPALSAGSAARFAWQRSVPASIVWGIVLLGLSGQFAPATACAPLLVYAWQRFLKVRLGGMTGDCLGAGIEIVEGLLLLTAVLAAAVPVKAPLHF